MLDFRAPSYQRIELDGFTVRTNNSACLEKYDLLDKGILHFVNALSDLVESKKEELPEEDFKVLSFTLKRVMIDYEDGELYDYLVHTHGPEAIQFNAWVHFALDCIWTVCVRTFTDMPTSILEEYGLSEWPRRSGSMGREGNKAVMAAIHARSDIYGHNGGIPPQMVRGILFNENVDDTF